MMEKRPQSTNTVGRHCGQDRQLVSRRRGGAANPAEDLIRARDNGLPEPSAKVLNFSALVPLHLAI